MCNLSHLSPPGRADRGWGLGVGDWVCNLSPLSPPGRGAGGEGIAPSPAGLPPSSPGLGPCGPLNSNPSPRGGEGRRSVRLVWWWTLARSGLILPGLLFGPGAVLGAPPRPWWKIDNCATIPRGAIPPPVGTRVNTVLHGQAFRAEAADFVVHKHEWYLGGREPGPYGRRHLATIGARLPAVPFAVVVEPVEPEELPQASPASIAELNEARRLRVVEALLACGIEDANQRVVLGYPRAEGLAGSSAERIGTRYLGGTGGTAAGAGGGGSFTSPGGFGFGSGGAFGSGFR
jgi:hypothetical protein